MEGWKQQNSHSHQALYFNLYFIIAFLLAADITLPNPPRGVGHHPEIDTSRVCHKVEVGQVSEGGVGNSIADTAGGTAIMSCEEYLTKSGYLTFDLGVMPTINWR